MGESRFDLQLINAMLAQLSEVTERRAAENRTAQLLQQKQGGGPSQGASRRTQELRDDYSLVVAIDFGTTFSGYAFSFKTSQTDIKMNKNWGSSLGFSSYKTATCALLGPDRKLIKFGFDAQKEYASMTVQEARKHYFIEKFKMALHNAKVRT